MVKVFKYELPTLVGKHKIQLPVNYKFLSLQEQDGKMVMWCVVDPRNRKVDVELIIAFTGEEIKGSRDYWGTCQVDGLVYHVFQVIH